MSKSKIAESLAAENPLFQQFEKRLSKWKAEGAASEEQLGRAVEELELSVRAYNCLKNSSIETIGELRDKTESELLRMKNFGLKSLREVEEVLACRNLSLKPRF